MPSHCTIPALNNHLSASQTANIKSVSLAVCWTSALLSLDAFCADLFCCWTLKRYPFNDRYPKYWPKREPSNAGDPNNPITSHGCAMYGTVAVVNEDNPTPARKDRVIAQTHENIRHLTERKSAITEVNPPWHSDANSKSNVCAIIEMYNCFAKLWVYVMKYFPCQTRPGVNLLNPYLKTYLVITLFGIIKENLTLTKISK